MDTVDIISSNYLVNRSVYQGPSFISHHHSCQYLCGAQYCNGDQAILLSCCLIPYCHRALKRQTREANDTLLPLSLPSARIISNSELIKCWNPGFEQCSVRRATAEKIILIWVSELIMCNTVSSFHNKCTTLQVWMELKRFPLCLFKDNMYPGHLQSHVQLRIAHSKND